MQHRVYGRLGYEVSALGMGCMRLPRIYHEQGSAEVDREKAVELIRGAVDQGVTYFDSAFTYHHKTSEEILGMALEGGYRKKVKIATKQPFGAMKTQDQIRRNLESTLKKLRTDHLDVYLIHNIQEGMWDEIKRRRIIEEYERFRDEGMIGAIGFSYHGKFPAFREILEYYPWDMCQVQQNLLDVDKEVTDQAIRLAGEKGAALVIMEPLRGGGLATPTPAVKRLYDSFPVRRSAAEWAFRHLLDYPQVSCILSGMTTLEQLQQNVEIFSRPDAVAGCISREERALLTKVKTAYESVQSIPCTACEYCLPCPQGVDIPGIFDQYNEGMMFENFSQPQRGYMFIQKAKASADYCVECGACEKKCPQHIDIAAQLKKADHALSGWIE